MSPPPRSGPARLFYDARCGRCTVFARAHQWSSRSRLRAVPYDGAEARSALGDLDEATRFAYAHLVDDDGRRSGSAIMTSLVGLVLGPTAERAVTGVPPLGGGLRWMYDRLWNYRRTHGCAAPARLVLA